MGGKMKGHGNNNSRVIKCSYGFMLMIAFGAAIVGVMGVHKLRETRIFHLLLKDKDRQLFSLQLLLQKERDYAKESKRETKEMKSKLYTLRAQKADLDSKILEMQSTISSLKDEQKAMETALEEKQNELKILRDKETESNKITPQLVSLTETLKQKEAEIRELKKSVSAPLKVWSVSEDDPSNPKINLTLPQAYRNEITETGINLTRIGEENGNGSMDGSRKEAEDSMDGRHLDKGKEESKENGTERTLKLGFEIENHGDEGVSDSKEIGVIYKGGVNFEMPEKTENDESIMGRGNRLRKGKGKRWRRIANNAVEGKRKKVVENGEVHKTENFEEQSEDKTDLVQESTLNVQMNEESHLVSKLAVVSTNKNEGGSSEVGKKMSKIVEKAKMEDEIIHKRGETGNGENVGKRAEKTGEMLQDLELPLNRTVDGEGKGKLGEIGTKEEKVDDEKIEG